MAPTLALTPDTLPSGTVAQPYDSDPVKTSGGTAPYTYHISSGTLPNGLNLSSGGALSGTPKGGGQFTFTVRATDANGFTEEKTYTLQIDKPTIVLAKASLTDATQGTAYSASIPSASGGTAPYRYALSAGSSLPAGLSLDADSGAISGTPTATGDFSFSITATDSSTGNGPYSATQSYAMAVAVAKPLAKPVSLALGYDAPATEVPLNIDGKAESVALASQPTNGTAQVSGLKISYQPKSGFAGTDSFSYTASNASGSSAPATISVSVSAPTVSLPSQTLDKATQGTAYSTSIPGASGGTAPYRYALASGSSLPDGLSLDADSGAISGTPTAAGDFSFSITATDSSTGSGPYSAAQSYTIAVAGAKPVAMPVSLTLPHNAPATKLPLKFQGGKPDAVAVMTQPRNGTVRVSGLEISYQPKPGFAGTDSFTYAASNASGSSAPATVELTMVAAAVAPVASISASKPSPIRTLVGTPFTETFTFNGGTPPWRDYQVKGLPAGLSVTSSTANSVTVAGTPSTVGHFSLSVSASDSDTAAAKPAAASPSNNAKTGVTATQDFILDVQKPEITTAPAVLPNATPQTSGAGGTSEAGTAYSQRLTAHGGAAPYRFALTQGALPDALTLSEDGMISGQAKAVGTFDFTITVSDAYKSSASKDYRITVSAPALALLSAALAPVTAGEAYLQGLEVEGGRAPFRFALTQGALPDGLSLSDDGKISGQARAVGTFDFTITVSDAYHSSASQNYRITVSAPTLALLPAALAPGIVEEPYLQAFETQGGNAPYRYAVTHGALPTGLTLTDTGLLHGKPTLQGSFAFSVTVTDTLGGKGEQAYVMDIFDRPDPTQDAEVRGLINAQIESSIRFMRAQDSNFHARLETLHSGGGRTRVSNKLHLAGGTQSCSPRAGRAAETDCAPQAKPQPHPHDPAAPDTEPQAGTQNLADENIDWGLWTAGYLSIGKAGSEDGGGSLSFDTDGVSMGIDRRFGSKLDLGIGLGWARDHTEVGDHGSRSVGSARTAALYGSYHPNDTLFVDAVLGYESLAFDLQRHITGHESFAKGHRTGHGVFGSAAVGADLQLNQRIQVRPYVRTDMARIGLDPYSETDNAIYGLHQGKLNIRASSVNLGLRIEDRLTRSWGRITNHVRLELQNERQSSGPVDIHYTKNPSRQYAYSRSNRRRHRTAIHIGSHLEWSNGWAVGLTYQGEFAGHDKSHGVTLEIDKSF